MNERPRTLEVTIGTGSGGRTRGQSDIIAIVILFGMVALGAMAVLITGGYLVDSVQGSSEHEVAKDSAVQTHQAISEALQSGEATNLALTDDVDVTVVQSGSIGIEMTNGSDVCSTNVEADLGAIVYDTPRGAVIYQGGAVWEETDGGLSTERSPPISYEEDSARISIQTVSADADTFRDGMARPDETMQAAKIQKTDRMLRSCPANGYTNLQINVTSPNYADGWEEHFEARVNTSANVSVDRVGDTISANITNATSAHGSRGLRFANISAPDIVGDPADGLTGSFEIDANVANDGFSTREARTWIRIEGDGGADVTFNSTEETIPPAEQRWTNVTDSDLNYSDLIAHPHLTAGQQYDYTLELVDGNGNVVSEVPGEFFLAESGGGALTLTPPSHELDPAHNELTVNATLYNTLTTNETTDVTFNVTDEDVSASGGPTDVDVSGYGGVAEVSYGPMNVSALPAGLYEYEVEGAGETIPSEFAISNRSQSNLAGNLLLDSVDAPTSVEYDNGSFVANATVVNLGDAPAGADLELDLESGHDVPPTPIAGLGSHNTTNEEVSISESTLEGLPVGNVHNYTITLNGTDSATDPINGSFYLGNPGPDPVIENTSADGENATIDARLSNHGLENVTNTSATLTFYGQDGAPLGSKETGEYHLRPNESLTATFDLETSGLAGTYDYQVEFDDEMKSGTITFDSVDGGGDDVTITAPGNGTVTVLGTEVSGLQDNWHSSEKYWSPVSVTSVLTIDGETNRTPFRNTATDDPDSLHDMRNLNSYDTQEATYSHHWSQVEGETASMTVSSTLWQGSYSPHRWTDVNDRYEDGHRWEDYHPPWYVWDEAATEANASKAEENDLVRVLLDGDPVPNVDAASHDQRSAREVLNQGAGERVDPDGNLSLGPHEAVFLVELTDDDATWDRAFQTEGDPDYNDVIVLVGFNPDDPESVDFGVSEDGSRLVIGSNPDTGADNGSEGIDGIGASVDEDGSSSPSAPDTSAPDPGSPSDPEEIDVDVGGVLIG